MTCQPDGWDDESCPGFNTASGMRSHVTRPSYFDPFRTGTFQYRKRYEITCDNDERVVQCMLTGRFNTASGMRSHVTQWRFSEEGRLNVSIPQAV